MQKVRHYINSVKREFITYFIIGISGALFDVGTLYLIKEFLGFPPVVAVAINQILVIAYVFCCNRYFTFRGGSGQSPTGQIVRFLLVCGLNYAIAILWMWVFIRYAEHHYLLVRLSNIIMAVSWNFLLYKYVVYRRPVGVADSIHTPLDGV